MYNYVCACVCVGTSIWKSEDNFQEYGLLSTWFILFLSFFLWCLAYFRFWTQKYIPQFHLPSWNKNAGITDVHHHIWLLRWTLGSKLRLWSFVVSVLPTEAFSRPLTVNFKWNSKTIPLGFGVCNSSSILYIKKYSNLLIWDISESR